VELYEQIRREYEHGSGTIREVSRKLGCIGGGTQALSSAMLGKEVAEREHPSLRQRFHSSTRSWRPTARRPESSATRLIGYGCGCGRDAGS